MLKRRPAGSTIRMSGYVMYARGGVVLTLICRVQGVDDVRFHSLWTDEGNPDADGHPTTWRAIQTRDTPLEFFNE